MMKFVAIDFETANQYRNSACSLAAVTVEGTQVKREAYSLIKPPIMKFDEQNIRIHGIRPEQVVNKQTFDQLWERIYDHLVGNVVIAHFAVFDIGVLRSTLQTYHLQQPVFKYACTVEISRKVWPELPNHKLDTVGHYLGATFQHHQALDDARVCARIATAAAEKVGANSMEELVKMLGLRLKSF